MPHALTVERIKLALGRNYSRPESQQRATRTWETRVNHIREKRCGCCFSRSHDITTCPYRERDDV